MGRAEDLFARIESEGVSAIDTLIAERASEELFLDFKRSRFNGEGALLHDHDRGSLKKAIAGFANSEGGVIVWGVECSKQTEKGDVASTKVPLVNPRRFVSWLEGATSGCTVPPVIGVRSIAVLSGDEMGFVATYIPKSSFAPHQLVNEGKYIIRAGSDFVPAPHGVVAGLFGRPPHPVVFPNYEFRPFYDQSAQLQSTFSILLVNNGQIAAEDLFVSLMTENGAAESAYITFQKLIDWPTTSGLGLDSSLISPREFRLAPRGLVKVASVTLWLKPPIQNNVRLTLTTGCRGAIPHSQDIRISATDIQAELDNSLSSNRVIKPGVDHYEISTRIFKDLQHF
jgi:hypothetical protein